MIPEGSMTGFHNDAVVAEIFEAKSQMPANQPEGLWNTEITNGMRTDSWVVHLDDSVYFNLSDAEENGRFSSHLH